MKTVVHLISMPWATVNRPSIQTGCLKAHLDAAFGSSVTTHAYSAHLAITLMYGKTSDLELYDKFEVEGEYLYFFLFYRRFLYKKNRRFNLSPKRLVDHFNQRRKHASSQLTMAELKRLESVTTEYIEKEIIPKLDRHAVNVVGFTMTFDQVYASAFCANYLRARLPEYRMVFLLGGMTATYPFVNGLFREFGIDAYVVVGEGEKKLESIVSRLLALKDSESDRLGNAVTDSAPGVFSVNAPPNMLKRESAFFKTQVTFESLPLPDYDEYFETLGRFADASSLPTITQRNIVVPVEGSRGCFAHCDFCGLNYIWDGFRKASAPTVLRKVTAVTEKYKVGNVLFVDNVCDTWAEAYSDELIRTGSKVHSMMELRVHHPEQFWTRLAMAGTAEFLVGIETISPALLKVVGKGTSVIQNLRVLKWLTELGIMKYANLITHHPRSTLDDIEVTKDLLTRISHFGLMSLTEFSLDIGSPLFESLSMDERQQLRQVIGTKLHPSVDRFLVARSKGYLPSKKQGGFGLKPNVVKAWDRFDDWYRKFLEQTALLRPSFTCSRNPSGSIRLRDVRGGWEKHIWLTGKKAEVFSACHQGLRPEYIAKTTGVPEDETRNLLSELVEENLVLEIEGHYLSLALRHRDELVARATLPGGAGLA